MSSPLQVISVRLPNKLHQQLKVLAVARRQNPSELIRELIECEVASSGSPARQLERTEKAPTFAADLIERLTRAAIFAELSLEQFTASEDPDLTRQLQRKAAAETAKFFGTSQPCVAEESRPQLSDEQLEIAKKFASG